MTEELIKETHRILIKGLKTEEGTPIKAGEYRQTLVHAGDQLFPPHEHVPDNMKSLVHEYNLKAADVSHDPYELASWFLHQICDNPCTRFKMAMAVCVNCLHATPF